ncbi:transcriptional regulator [Saccharothrix sp. 6-C]|nr:transcriptional regulator [Saccharothrix sp. 6-C]
MDARANTDLADMADWLDERAGRAPGESRAKVHAKLSTFEAGALVDRRYRRARVSREEIVRALRAYYRRGVAGHGMYRVRCGGEDVRTSILARPEWLDQPASLTAENDRLVLAGRRDGPRAALSEVAAEAAVDRLAEWAALDVRVMNLPLYRLLRVDVGSAIEGTVGLVDFAEYALTADLLEGELVEAVVSGAGTGALPLRDEFLPNLDAVLDLPGRVCAGGVLALCAIARPRDPYRGAPDYVLLVQERSGHVLNTSGRLAVVPKGFHQPLTDVRADARVSATLLRELEEELFGRDEVDTTAGEGRAAAPMHPGRWSAPMRWLREDPSRMRMECTGFGFNLVSGNYEFASLVVIEDEEFWTRFGGAVEANWEASGLRLYSSLDDELVTDLVTHESWSNEGLFALLQGLRRLAGIGGRRVKLPAIEVSGL